jgi:hypothetical protein
VYDCGALIAIDNRDAGVLQRHERRIGRGNRVIVPAPAAAQAVREPQRQARLMLALKGCDVMPFGKDSVNMAGVLLAGAGRSDVVDAFVVLAAARTEAAVVTTDGDDIRHLLDTLGVRLPVLAP